MKLLLRVIASLSIAATLVPSIAFAGTPSFDPGLILYDGELKNYTAMTSIEIQSFLNDRGGILSEMHFTDRDGKNRTAAEIIARAATAAKINPQVLLVLLQKEQSLIEATAPTLNALDWALGYGVCDSCSKTDPLLRKYRGFTSQMYGAANRLREYLDHPERFSWIKRGKPVAISGATIIPYTNATRAMYLYTPHLAGARSFWNIWTRYFGKPYPDGTVLRDARNSDTWRIEGGLRRKFANDSVAASMIDERFMVTVPGSVLSNYPQGAPIKFSNYSLVRTPSGAVYLLVDNKKRVIISQTVFRTLGFNPDELIAVKDKDIKDYPSGTPITATSDAPYGTVYEDEQTGERFLVTAGIRHQVTSTAILNAVVPNATVVRTTTNELKRYTIGAPLYFPDGTLLTNADGILAVISGGKRQEFASLETAIALGYAPSQAVYVNNAIWQLHEQGDLITVTPTTAESSGPQDGPLAQSNLGR